MCKANENIIEILHRNIYVSFTFRCVTSFPDSSDRKAVFFYDFAKIIL